MLYLFNGMNLKGLIALVLFSVAVPAFAVPTGAIYAEIRLANGEVLKNAQFLSQTPTRISLRVGDTLRQIDKEQLPEGLRKIYPLDPEAAKKRAAETLAQKERLAGHQSASNEKAGLMRRNEKAEASKRQAILSIIDRKSASIKARIQEVYPNSVDREPYFGSIDRDRDQVVQFLAGLHIGISTAEVDQLAWTIFKGRNPDKQVSAEGTQSWSVRKKLLDGTGLTFSINFTRDGLVDNWSMY